MSHSHRLVLYKEQRNFIIYGNATNSNSAGYFDVNETVCMYRVKCKSVKSLTMFDKNVMKSRGTCN
jgi:hypothetical protein